MFCCSKLYDSILFCCLKIVMIYVVLLFKGRDEQKQQAGAGCGKELALDEKITAASERKKGFCPPTSQHAPPPAAATVHNRPHAQGR